MTIQWIRSEVPHQPKKAYFWQAMGITLGGNVLLAGIKYFVYLRTGSVAIFADAANSLSDVLYSLLMMLGLWIAMRPPDLSHPQGHGRFEPFVGLLIALSMAFAGYEALSQAIQRFQQGPVPIEPGLPTITLLVSAGIKAGMFVAIRHLAQLMRSPALGATARDNLSDVLTSTAALIGVLGSRYLTPLLDPIAGVLVAVWIFRAAFGVGRENVNYLTGGGAPEELREQIAEAAQQVPGVQRVHHVMTDYVGPRLVVDMHINVEGSTPLDTVHSIEEAVIQRVQQFPEVDRVYVHVEPEGEN
jgi:cation diffusion facilitator family transporter